MGVGVDRGIGSGRVVCTYTYTYMLIIAIYKVEAGWCTSVKRFSENVLGEFWKKSHTLFIFQNFTHTRGTKNPMHNAFCQPICVFCVVKANATPTSAPTVVQILRRAA